MCVEASDGCAGEAIEAKVPVAVCSTSNERAVSTIVRVLLGPEAESKMRVFAGDIVQKKKPSPDIYNLAASELKVDPSRSAPLTWLHLVKDVRDMPPSSGDLIWSRDLSLCNTLPARAVFLHATEAGSILSMAHLRRCCQYMKTAKQRVASSRGKTAKTTA